MRCNVVEFGAVGDGVTRNTEAIGRALAALQAQGGGELYFPPGVYLSGSIVLIGNLTLYLERGAILRASPDLADYPEDTSVGNNWLRYYFLRGSDLAGIAIAGDGVIDGNGMAFWEKTYYSGDTDATLAPNQPIINYHVYKPYEKRPVLLYLTGCSDVKITGITVKNSAAFTIWLIDCHRCLIDGITMRNPRNGPNTDAIDIDCSQQVRIVNCDIEAGDDCIALKSDPNRLGKFRPCSGIVVSNCVLSSVTCAIRVGYEGDAPIRDVVFSDLVIYDSRHGIDILSIAPVCALQIEHGTPIENLSFSNIVMRNVGQAFFIWAGNETPRTDFSGYIKNLHFTNIIADCVATSYVGSKDAVAISDLLFRDVTLHVADLPTVGVTEQADETAPSHWGGHWKSGGLRFRRVARLKLENVRVTCENTAYPAIICQELSES